MNFSIYTLRMSGILESIKLYLSWPNLTINIFLVYRRSQDQGTSAEEIKLDETCKSTAMAEGLSIPSEVYG